MRPHVPLAARESRELATLERWACRVAVLVMLASLLALALWY